MAGAVEQGDDRADGVRGSPATAAGPTAVLIAGPTASGKSGLALAIAEQTGGTIINADSMQVYRDLRVLTARPAVEDEARCPHRLYGHVDGADAYSAGRWVREAAAAIAAERAAGRLPIVVGGTGLYFLALLDGLSPIPEVPDPIRARWRTEAETVGAAGLHRLLAERDTAMAERLAPTDAQRIVRALEVLEATGRSLAYWQALPRQPVLAAEATLRLVVTPDRAALYRACDARLETMVAEGALDEVAALMERQLDPGLPVMRALGVAPFARHLRGECDLAAALGAAQLETRQYVKRQLTWLRRHMIAWTSVRTQLLETETGRIVALIKAVG